ncbi:DNA primase [Polynucleobacter kasalickyi]|uniref:DNA primase n=1 Tax=Polynucleobacter kasalickyi TaxID=1938817 RepID=A0A1W1YF60_9BURK|nr:DNA primase [Polynucleobacter kasalickyi]SMC34795.1 DNA primase [Polynucleobacter kasalickyi]
MIPRAFIDELLSRVDIVDVVGKSVTLKKAGSNLQGLCPFHQEKSPSFSVSETKQFYHCFGCGAHGSAISFLMEYAGLTFTDAVEELAQGVGLTVPKEAVAMNSPLHQQLSSRLFEVMDKAATFFKETLKKDQRAKNYLINRGLSGEVALRFGIGYVADAWQNLEAVFGSYTQSEVANTLAEVGLLIQSEGDGKTSVKRYDRFRDRIIFPIRNLKGQVIGFGGRIIDKGEPKYLNSPETPLFKKGMTLYGLFEARKFIREMSYALVCEGYMDVVALAQLGFPNAVATLGTACTETHVQLLLKHTDKVVFSFDGDAAGVRAAKRAFEACIPLLSDEKEIRFLFLPKEHDPDSFVRENGAKAFQDEIEKSMPLSLFFMQVIGENIDWKTAEGRAQAQNESKQYFKKMPAIALRVQILRDLALRLGSTQQELEQFFGLPSTIVQDVPIKPLEPKTNYKNKDWQKKADLRALENLAKQKPITPSDLPIQIIKLLIQYPQLGKKLSAKEAEDLISIATNRTKQAGLIMKDLIQLCRLEPDDSNFSSFQNVLSQSEFASAYNSLLRKLLETEFTFEEATLHVQGALKKINRDIIKSEMEAISDRISKQIHTDEDLMRYRELGLQLKTA